MLLKKFQNQRTVNSGFWEKITIKVLEVSLHQELVKNWTRFYDRCNHKKRVKKNNNFCVRNSKQSHKLWEFYITISYNTYIVNSMI
jgi:hypothetical protein